MNTTENNKLIAEFMGVKTLTVDELKSILKTNRENGLIHTPQAEVLEDLKYHSSWDWLMPVVEKIESLDYEFFIVQNRCKINRCGDLSIANITHLEVITNKLDATYETVVEFIKWYNETID